MQSGQVYANFIRVGLLKKIWCQAKTSDLVWPAKQLEVSYNYDNFQN